MPSNWPQMLEIDLKVFGDYLKQDENESPGMEGLTELIWNVQYAYHDVANLLSNIPSRLPCWPDRSDRPGSFTVVSDTVLSSVVPSFWKIATALESAARCFTPLRKPVGPHFSVDSFAAAAIARMALEESAWLVELLSKLRATQARYPLINDPPALSAACHQFSQTSVKVMGHKSRIAQTGQRVAYRSPYLPNWPEDLPVNVWTYLSAVTHPSLPGKNVFYVDGFTRPAMNKFAQDGADRGSGWLVSRPSEAQKLATGAVALGALTFAGIWGYEATDEVLKILGADATRRGAVELGLLQIIRTHEAGNRAREDREG